MYGRVMIAVVLEDAAFIIAQFGLSTTDMYVPHPGHELPRNQASDQAQMTVSPLGAIVLADTISHLGWEIPHQWRDQTTAHWSQNSVVKAFAKHLVDTGRTLPGANAADTIICWTGRPRLTEAEVVTALNEAADIVRGVKPTSAGGAS